MANTYDVDILCGYVMKTFQREPERHIYEENLQSTQRVIHKGWATKQP
jgi:hypothetical protein